VDTPDLRAATVAAVAAGWVVVLVEQPWRVAGRRVATAPAQLDRAWTAVVEHLRTTGGVTGRLVLGGRSAGARVACRTATALGADAVLLLAFPLHPPGRPERSRAGELAAAGVPALVVQGRRDAFGRPDEVTALGLAGVRVAEVPGDHGLHAEPQAVGRAVGGWLAGLDRPAGMPGGQVLLCTDEPPGDSEL
jgi:uncharacterized protein